MSITFILVILLTILTISYIIFAYVYKPWSVSMTLIDRGPINLNTKKNYNFIPALNTQDNYTFSFYVQPGMYNRTQTLSSASDDIDETLIPIMYWSDVFYFTHNTNKNNTTLYINQIGVTADVRRYTPIPCPVLPETKWTHVAIVIEGRRFNILYNGKVVASKLIPNMPNITSRGILSSGSPMLNGQLAYVSFNNRAMSPDEIMIEYNDTSDSRGRPYIDGSLSDIFSIFGCPAGLCSSVPPSTPPSKAMMSWSTPYS